MALNYWPQITQIRQIKKTKKLITGASGTEGPCKEQAVCEDPAFRSLLRLSVGTI